MEKNCMNKRRPFACLSEDNDQYICTAISQHEKVQCPDLYENHVCRTPSNILNQEY